MLAKKSSEEKTCNVVKCKEPAARSLSAKKVGKELDLEIGPRDKKAHLCREHYKQFRKATKRDRKFEKLGRG